MTDLKKELAGLFHTYREVSEMQDPAVVDFVECRCRLHRKLVHSVKDGEGCDAKALGRFPPVWGANQVIGHKFCHASAFQRRADSALVQACFRELPAVMAVEGDDGVEAQSPYEGPSHVAAEFGAQYCYMDGIRGGHRARVARVVGNNPLVLDYMRLLVHVGRAQMKTLELVQVGTGQFHVVKSESVKGQKVDAGVRHLEDLVRAIKKVGPTARIGMDVAEWLRLNSVVLPASAARDAVYMSRVAVTLPFDPGASVRYRKFALIGDRVLKLLLAVRTMNMSVSVGDVSRVEMQTQSDLALAGLLRAKGFDRFVQTANNVDIYSAKVGGTLFEVIVGVLYSYLGMAAVEKFAELVELKFEV